MVKRASKWRNKDEVEQVREAERRAKVKWETAIKYAKRVASANPYRRTAVLTDAEVQELATKLGV